MLKRLLIAVFVLGLIVTLSGIASSDVGLKPEKATKTRVINNENLVGVQDR